MYIVTETIFADGQPSSGQRCDNDAELVAHARALALRVSASDAESITSAASAKAYLKDFALNQVQIITRQAFLLRENWHLLIEELAREMGWMDDCIAEQLLDQCGADILRIGQHLEDEQVSYRKEFNEGTTIYTFSDGSGLKSRGSMIIVMTPEKESEDSND